MWYLRNEPNPSGAYPSPQSNKFSGSIPITDEQLQVFLQYNGFVTVTVDGDNVTMEPNLELWKAFKAEQEASEAAASAAAEIAAAKEALTSTDYKIIKCSEAQMAGEHLPYDIVALHAERQALRDKINELEAI